MYFVYFYQIFCYVFIVDDGISFRRKIEGDLEYFVDLFFIFCYGEVVDCINVDGIYVFVNMNGYIKGVRNEIFVFRLVLVQVKEKNLCQGFVVV